MLSYCLLSFLLPLLFLLLPLSVPVISVLLCHPVIHCCPCHPVVSILYSCCLCFTLLSCCPLMSVVLFSPLLLCHPLLLSLLYLSSLSSLVSCVVLWSLVLSQLFPLRLWPYIEEILLDVKNQERSVWCVRTMVLKTGLKVEIPVSRQC